MKKKKQSYQLLSKTTGKAAIKSVGKLKPKK